MTCDYSYSDRRHTAAAARPVAAPDQRTSGLLRPSLDELLRGAVQNHGH